MSHAGLRLWLGLARSCTDLPRAQRVRCLLFNRQMQELVELATPIFGERFAVDEATPAVERERCSECRAGARLETEASHSARPGYCDDVRKQRRCDATAEEVRVGAHRFELAGT